MAFQLSPGINVSEIDLTNAVPAVGTSEGAFVGTFRWGPTNERVLLSSEVELVSRFGKPYNDNAGWSNQQSFFSAANFLGYSNALYVTRTEDSTALISAGTNFSARYRGALGNSIKVIACSSSATAFEDAGTVTDSIVDRSGINIARGGIEATIKGPDVTPGAAVTFNPTLARDFNGGDLSNGATATITDVTAASAVPEGTGATDNQFTTDSDHTFVTGDEVTVTFTSAFADLTSGNSYFVRYVDADTFTLHNSRADAVANTAPVALNTANVGAAATAQTDLTFVRAGVAPNTFNIENHGFATGDDVKYTTPSGSGTAIGNLTENQVLYVIRVDDDNFQVALTSEAAAAGGIYDVYLGSATDGDHAFAPQAADIPVGNADATLNFFKPGDFIVVGDNVKLKIASVGDFNAGSNTIILTLEKKYWGPALGNPNAPVTTNSYKYQWEGSEYFDKAPETGKFHIAVIDSDGGITGIADTLLETFPNLSTTPGAKNFDGSAAYIGQVLDVDDGISGYIKLETDVAGFTVPSRVSEQLSGGSDGLSETDVNGMGNVMEGWDLYKSSDQVDVSLLVTGWANADIQNYVMDNVAEVRKDCVAFVSPSIDSVTAQSIVDYAAPLSGSSYSVIDTGYKYQYDKYNDSYVWVPLNADIAGTCARTDGDRDPWFSPAGYSRGQIKNVVKLNLNPNKTQRDLLYKNNINPVIIEPGSGAILFGDKTMQRNPSAFDRINVRRLFIVLEKAIALASKSTLFEFNDEFTRATFRNMIEPFLRDVQGRRGIYDFQVVCDETNNTGEVIDTNRFIGDIYIKPARSINFIQLNFVAVRTGVEFNEIIGQ